MVFVGALLLGFLTIAVIFVLGMRAKTPWVLDAVRWFARVIGDPRQMRSAGTPGALASVIRHRGRTSGRAYETPRRGGGHRGRVEDGFVIATVYGSRMDWLKNVLSSGSAAIVNEGHTYQVDHPEVIPIEAADAYFPAEHQRSHRRYRVDQCLRVRRVEPSSDKAGERVTDPE